MSGRLIGPKTWNRNVKIFRARLDSPQTVWAPCLMNYIINCALVYMRPEMAMEFGSTKWNQCVLSGLPTDSPLFYFWDC